MAPHVIIIMADQLRHDFVRSEFTPHICSLMEESIVFDRAYCASPLCVPARGSFYTGRYPNETGSIINPWEPLNALHGNVRRGIPNLYEMMEAEWDSCHAGKQHFYSTPTRLDQRTDSPTRFLATESTYADEMSEASVPKPGGRDFRGIVPEMAHGTTTRATVYSAPHVECYPHGFDRFPDAHFTRAAVDAIKGHDSQRPLLLNATYFAPHPPYHVPEPWYSLHTDVEVSPNVGRWYPGQSPLQLYNYPGLVGPHYSLAQWEAAWSVYAGLVGLLDHCVGLIIGALEECNMYDDSLIIFTSDHGEMLGSHQLWQKMCMYEESVRTPLSLKLPTGASVPPNRSGMISSPVSGIDVFPTICELCGIESPPVSGHSLVDLMMTPDEGRSIFIQFDGNGARGNFQRCLIQDRKKLIVDIFKDETFLELYDLDNDPLETANLAFDEANAEEVDEMTSTVRDHMKATGDMLPELEVTHSKFLGTYGPFLRGTAEPFVK